MGCRPVGRRAHEGGGPPAGSCCPPSRAWQRRGNRRRRRRRGKRAGPRQTIDPCVSTTRRRPRDPDPITRHTRSVVPAISSQPDPYACVHTVPCFTCRPLASHGANFNLFHACCLQLQFLFQKKCQRIFHRSQCHFI